MRKVDSRVGLSIDSGSASCASDLSDSEGSWGEEACAKEVPTSVSLDELSRCGGGGDDGRLSNTLLAGGGGVDDPLQSSSLCLNPDGVSSWSHQSRDAGGLRDLPRTPSFRSRMHRRPEDDGMEEDLLSNSRPRTRRETATSWDDDVRIARHPRAPSLRFCLTLGTLSLVLLSLTSTNSSPGGNHGERPPIQLDIRREEVLLPFHSYPDNSQRGPNRIARKAEGLHAKPFPKDYFTDEDQLPLENPRAVKAKESATTEDSTHPSIRKVTGTRSNLAMARSAERRPVFGAAAGPPPMERVVLDDAPPLKAVDGVRSGEDDWQNSEGSSNWTSWLAAVALIAMLVETGYKEYRQCRMDDFFEEHRRL